MQKKKKGHPNYRRYWPSQLEHLWYFSPTPSVQSIHKGEDDFSSTPMFPMANTCVNCIRSSCDIPAVQGEV
ncbi:hypothetical protein R3I94_002513 [Phoxinus phoxinus]